MKSQSEEGTQNLEESLATELYFANQKFKYPPKILLMQIEKYLKPIPSNNVNYIIENYSDQNVFSLFHGCVCDDLTILN